MTVVIVLYLKDILHLAEKDIEIVAFGFLPGPE